MLDHMFGTCGSKPNKYEITYFDGLFSDHTWVLTRDRPIIGWADYRLGRLSAQIFGNLIYNFF